MIVDLQSIATAEKFEAEVCIVGAGAAGIPLALELAAKGVGVVLLEGGAVGYDNATQALYEGTLAGHDNTDLVYSRLRQFGGTTQHWTGMCAPLDEIDFEARACNGNIEWPFARSALDAFYARAHDYLELGEYRYSTEQWEGLLAGDPLPLPGALLDHGFYQQSPPTRFADAYLGDIEKARTIRCLINANVTDIVLGESGDMVDHVTVGALSGTTATVKAKKFVLACGGIENARLLLNADSQRPAGLGNENDLVGRHFMDHLHIEASQIALSDSRRDLGYYRQVTDTSSLLIGLKVQAALMRRQNLLNNTAFFTIVWKDQAQNDDFRDHAWLSFSALAKTFARGEVPDRFAERVCNVAESPGSVITGLSRHIRRRISEGGEIDDVLLWQDAEQAPNPDSRVLLNADRDALGLRRTTLDWRILPADLESLRRTHEIIGRAFGEAGLGRLRIGLPEDGDLSGIYTAYHHMGTTRMHTDPRRGVVDGDGRMHTVPNLYIAGSSVFPTGGAANPTLTIVALAIRMADHLAETLAL
ncbi:FAD-dependent oxidoreductase [Roseitalea porphyridii]|uniref:GMC family oxidoreductase n=1 Tax=Roseitalea porphyridii TaxID=1852022 RepID=A0A4P6UWU3_9HYPH|nr:GMC family oxidoreductase [Roseitalea porphyridii]QBK29532.1 GMC family oxidoreductase [Roseitalea porphyridii]